MSNSEYREAFAKASSRAFRRPAARELAAWDEAHLSVPLNRQREILAALVTDERKSQRL